MKNWFIDFLLFLLLSISLSSGLESGCPGKESAIMDLSFSLNPQTSGLEFETGYDCSGTKYQFIIRNYENDNILMYIDGNGVINEIWPDHGIKKVVADSSLTFCSMKFGWCSHPMKCEAANHEVISGYSCFDNQVCCNFKDVDEYNSWYKKSSFNDQTISKELGAEWTRTLYFMNNPDEKIILSAKNVAVKENLPKKTSYILYSFVIIIFLAIIAFLSWMIWKKYQLLHEQ